MKIKNRNRKISLAVLLLAMLVLTPAVKAATVSTDKGDYSPGEIVIITGAGFEPYEAIDLSISIVYDGAVLIPDAEWSFEFADADGNFVTEYEVPETWLGMTLQLTATGLMSEREAKTMFTDGNATSISGYVYVSGTTTPIVGATVTCTAGSNQNPPLSATTNSSGYYVFTSGTGGVGKISFDGTTATLTLTATKTGYTDNSITFTVTNSTSYTNKNIELEALPVPVVTSVSPTDGATGVAVGTVITATFNIDMDSTTITAGALGSFLVNGGSVAGTVSYVNASKTATFTPDAVLEYSTTYNVTLTTDIESSTGVALAADYIWSFTTETEPLPSQYDITVTASPGGAIGGSFNVTYTKGGTTYTNELHYTTWIESVDADSTVTVSSPQDPINISATERYVFNNSYSPSSSVTMDGNKSITLNYTHQYLVTVTASPDDAKGGTFKVSYTQSGTTNTGVSETTVWSDWADAGTAVTVSDAQDPINISAAERYAFGSYSPSASVTMDADKSITLNYTHQYLATVTASPEDAKGGSFKISYTQLGTTNTGVSKNTEWSDWADAGTVVTISDPQEYVPSESGSGGVRYHFKNYNPDDGGTINAAMNITLEYDTQYKVTFAQTGLTDDVADDTKVVTVDSDNVVYVDLSFDKWINSGDTVEYKYEILVNSSVPGFQFWLSSVSGPATGFSVDNPITITGNYTELPLSAITAGGCPFDRDTGLEGQQFRLIFTQDPTNISTYKLTASNPGQFFYNVFYVGTPGLPASLALDIPFPFVTQGAMPVHVYASVSVVDGCYVPADEVLVLSALGGNSPNHTINVTVPDTGLVYVRIHLDYGLKKEVGYTKDTSNNAEKPLGTDAISDLTIYDFGVGGDLSDSQTIQNMNVFKRNPGFGGLVTGSVTGDTIANVEVKIYTSAKKLLATVTTDDDGFYYYYYKHTGKSATYYIEVNGVTQSVTVKANGLAIADFQI